MERVRGLRWRSKVLRPIDTTRRAAGGEEGTVEEEPLSPAARMFHEPNFNVYVMAIMGCKIKMNTHLIKDKLAHTLLKHPRFSSLQVVDHENGGVMKWVPTQVNLDHHVIVPDLDPNMDNPDQFLEDYIFNLTKTSIDISQPMWDLHLLNLRVSGAESVAILRVHHSLGDGTSLMSLALALTKKMSDPEAPPTIPVKRKSGSGRRGGLWWWAWTGIRLVWNTIVDVLMFIATVMFLKDTDNPLMGRPGSEFNPRRIVYRTVSLDDMKLVKNAMNLTINDVALAMTQAGLSRYLNRKYGESRKDDEEVPGRKKDCLPKSIRFRATLLINIRPSSGIQALADMMEKDTEAKWGNWVGYVLLPFTIGLRHDPLDYVREAKATVDRKKSSLESIYTSTIAHVFLKLFGVKVASELSHRVFTRTTMSFSNLVGPLEEIGFYGHPMTFLATSSYGQPHALMINFQSYVNKMTIILSVDENTVPDPYQLLDDLQESLHLIKAAVIEKGLVTH